MGERLFKAGRLLAFIAYRVGAYPVFEVSAYSNKYGTSQVQNKRGKTFIFCDFEDPPPRREYKEVHTHITDSWCFVTESGSAIY